MLLYGKNSVYERIKTRPETVRKVFLKEGFSSPEIEKALSRNGIVCSKVSDKKLSSIKSKKDLQGIVAEVDKFTYASFDALLSGKEKGNTLFFLDRINDPQNLGVIIRTAACFGGISIVIPEFEACGVTDAVLHVASGGENYVRISRVKNLTHAISAAKEEGFWIAGGILDDSAQDIGSFKFSFPLGLVLGSEGRGIRYGIDKHLDFKVRIPMEGVGISLNVAVSSAVFCYEISKQRSILYGKKKK